MRCCCALYGSHIFVPDDIIERGFFFYLDISNQLCIRLNGNNLLAHIWRNGPYLKSKFSQHLHRLEHFNQS